MAHVSDPDLLVLHELRLKGFASTDELSDRRGLSPTEVTGLLQRFAGDGLVRRSTGESFVWSLTAAGRTADERGLARELDEAGARDVVQGAFERFSALNAPLLETCTDWQLRSGEEGPEVNDHSDADYDLKVVERLHGLDDQVQPVCSELARVLDRFAGYGPRLRLARNHVDSGDLEWFDRPSVDSYHSVWFELHEDLLATLGLERGGVLA